MADLGDAWIDPGLVLKRTEMTRSSIEEAITRFRSAAALLDDARMVGAPPDCVAERERDLDAARALLIELGIDSRSDDIASSSY